MIKKITLKSLIALIILAANNNDLQGQVTIGNSEPPCIGALLDLKDNQKKGLGLPRVNLISNSSLQPCLDNSIADDPTQRKMHIGLVVYNVGTEVETTKEDRLCHGLHVWDGEKWQPVVPYFDPDVTNSRVTENLTITRGPNNEEVTTYSTAYFHGYSRVNSSGTPIATKSIYVCDKSKLKEIDAGQWMTMNLRTRYLPDATTLITLHTGTGNSGDSHVSPQYITPQNPTSLDQDNINRNGLLYNWAAATNNRDPNRELTGSEWSNPPTGIQGICPAGWHLPNTNELLQLYYLLNADYHHYSTTPYTPSSNNDTINELVAKSVTSVENQGTSLSTEQGGFDWRRVGARWSNSNSQSPTADYGKSGFLWTNTSGSVDEGTGNNGDKEKWNFRAYNMTLGFQKGFLGTSDSNKEIVNINILTYTSRVRLQSVRCKKDS